MDSTELESSLLGGLFSSPEYFEQVSADLHSKHFSDPLNRNIYDAMMKASSRDMQIDKISIKHLLNDAKCSERIDALNYVYGFQSEILQHAKLMRDIFGRNAIRNAAHKIDAVLNETKGDDLEATIEKAQAIINDALSIDTGKNHTRSYANILPNYLDMLKERVESEGDLSGLSTGFRELDEYTSGLFPHQLIILAARPAMGKTAALLNIAERATERSGEYALIFSLEMKAEELIQRSVASLAQINMGNLKRGQLTREETVRLKDNMDRIKETRIVVNDMSDATPARIRAEALKLKRELESRGERLGLIAVDYLQLMNDTGFGPSDRTAEVSSISRKLKKLAGELDLPVIALSQLNRALEQRPNKRPVVSDLRESGALEQDSDLIMFLYRDEVYYPESEAKGMAELIIGKQRSGSLGTINLRFEGQYSRFLDLPPKDQIGKMEHLKTDNELKEPELIELPVSEEDAPF